MLQELADGCHEGIQQRAEALQVVEEERARDFIVEDDDPNNGSEVSFKIGFPLKEGLDYKVNVYSVATFQGLTAESEPCHVKAFLGFENSEFYEEGRGKSVIHLIR